MNSLSFASGPGTTAATVLNFPVGARAIAMGEAYTAMADDASSLYWNPAGLAILNQSQASFMYNNLYEGLSYNNLNVATPLENGGIGASLSYLSYGDINGYSNSGAPTGSVNAYSGVGTLGAAWLGNFWSAGLNAKGVQGELADVKATGFATDLGLNVIYPKEVLDGGTIRFGTTLRNLGTGLKYLQETDPFPTEFRAGVSAVQLLDKKVNLSMDYGKARDNDSAFYFGSEYVLASMIALRAGYADSHSESNGLRLGIGIKVKDFSFDYAYGSYGDLGLSHRYEITYRFGVIRPTLTPEEREILRRGKQALRQGHYDQAVLLFNSLIELEPRYMPVRSLMKTAMAGSQRSEEYAKNMNNFKYSPNLSKAVTPDNNPEETQELEDLLNMSQPANAMAPASNDKTKGKVQ